MILIIGKTNRKSRGFTYLIALLLVMLIMVASTVIYTSTRYVLAKAREAEILYQGRVYYEAIKEYYNARTPHKYPQEFSDLINDPRFMNLHHMRKLRLIEKGKRWKRILSAKQRIIGVYYDSNNKPYKHSDFDKPFTSFVKAKSYQDWKFIYLPE